MPQDPHPLSARFLENSVCFLNVLHPQEKTGSIEEDQKMKVNLILMKRWAYLHNFHISNFYAMIATS